MENRKQKCPTCHWKMSYLPIFKLFFTFFGSIWSIYQYFLSIKLWTHRASSVKHQSEHQIGYIGMHCDAWVMLQNCPLPHFQVSQCIQMDPIWCSLWHLMLGTTLDNWFGYTLTYIYSNIHNFSEKELKTENRKPHF